MRNKAVFQEKGKTQNSEREERSERERDEFCVKFRISKWSYESWILNITTFIIIM